MAFKMKYSRGGFPFIGKAIRGAASRIFGGGQQANNDPAVRSRARQALHSGLGTGRRGLMAGLFGGGSAPMQGAATSPRLEPYTPLVKKDKTAFTHKAEGSDEHAKQHQKALERRRNKKKKKILQKNIGKYKFPKIT